MVVQKGYHQVTRDCTKCGTPMVQTERYYATDARLRIGTIKHRCPLGCTEYQERIETQTVTTPPKSAGPRKLKPGVLPIVIRKDGKQFRAKPAR